MRPIAAAVLSALLSGPVFAEEPATRLEVIVEKGYHPAALEAPAGRPVRLTFVRREYSGCTREVVFPTLGIRRELPVDEKVVIELPAQAAGEIPFHCGMRMVKGKLTVKG